MQPFDAGASSVRPLLAVGAGLTDGLLVRDVISNLNHHYRDHEKPRCELTSGRLGS